MRYQRTSVRGHNSNYRFQGYAHCLVAASYDEQVFKVGVDTFNTLRVMGYIKFFLHDDNNDDLVFVIAPIFL